MQEKIVAKIHDLENGEMKTIKIDDDKEILLSKINGEFFATGSKCTHYGAPLEDGVLSGETIVCPWHHACFNAKNGDLVEPPARDSLPNFDVEIDKDNVIVKLPDDIPDSRTPNMMERNPDDKTTYVIIGGGAAGNAAAQSMRESGYRGNIVMITQENRVPYDRPNLSKAYMQGEAEEEWMPLRDEDFYKDNGIELKFESKVKDLDTATRTINFEDGERLTYDKVLIATGGVPKELDVNGHDLENIFYLRSFADADVIIEASKNAKKVAVIGSSFIGMETADSLKSRGLDVTVISPDDVPFKNIFGEDIGNMFLNMHRDNGVEFKLNTGVKEFEGEEKVEAVLLDNDEKVEADMVIVGIGVTPTTEFVKGIDLEPDGGLPVDKHLMVDEHIYAAGDVATFKEKRTGEKMRIEHWRTAEQQGRIAGRNMAGIVTPYDSVPFFWTRQGGISVQYIGHAPDWDEIIVEGDIDEKDFIAYYVKNNLIYAAAGTGKGKRLAAIQHLMRQDRMPSPESIRDKSADLFEMVKI